MAVQKAVALGFRSIGTVSTGNMAASTAAYGARAGLETIVLLKEETLVAEPPGRGDLRPASSSGSRAITVVSFIESLEIGRKLGIYFMNSIDPVRVEGYKITGFEIFQGLGRRSPDYVFVPLSSGGHLIGLMRSFEDLIGAGFIHRCPTLVGVQAEGCAPLARAFAAGHFRYTRLDRTQTIAHAISNPAPPGGNVVLKMVREHGGLILSVRTTRSLPPRRCSPLRKASSANPNRP